MEIKNITREQNIELKNRQNLTISGIKKVKAVNENIIILELDDSTLTVNGGDIHVLKLDVEQGDMVLEGRFDAFKYSHGKQKGSFVKRVFG